MEKISLAEIERRFGIDTRRAMARIKTKQKPASFIYVMEAPDRKGLLEGKYFLVYRTALGDYLVYNVRSGEYQVYPGPLVAAIKNNVFNSGGRK